MHDNSLTALPPTPDHHQESSRARILQAALVEFAEHGFAGGRVDRIARRAGVNKAMIYYYFSSKAELHREIVSEFFGPVIEQAGTSLSRSADLDEVLKALTALYHDTLSGRPQLRRILLHELASPQSGLVEKLAGLIAGSGLPRHLTDLLTRGATEGRYRAVDVQQAVISFVAMNLGYLVLAPVIEKVVGISDPESFIRRRKEAIPDLFLYGVVVR